MAKVGKPKTIQGLAKFCAKIADDKKAENIVILDLTKVETAPADYFVICSCNTSHQMHSIADAIEEKCIKYKLDKPRVEGNEQSSWYLLDFFYVVVHIMLKEAREYYSLEKLWSDAKFIKLENDRFNKINVYEFTYY